MKKPNGTSLGIEASPGDCVITNTGRVAAVAQIPNGYKVALGRNMTGIRCNEKFTYPTFLLECLQLDRMREEIDRKTDVGDNPYLINCP